METATLSYLWLAWVFCNRLVWITAIVYLFNWALNRLTQSTNFSALKRISFALLRLKVVLTF